MTTQDRLQTFYEHLPTLLQEHPGEYAVVCDGKVSVYPTSEEAMTAGYKAYGVACDFLMKKIEPKT
jgi:hypothetical protein